MLARPSVARMSAPRPLFESGNLDPGDCGVWAGPTARYDQVQIETCNVPDMHVTIQAGYTFTAGAEREIDRDVAEELPTWPVITIPR